MKGKLGPIQPPSQAWTKSSPLAGNFVMLDGEEHYRISSFQKLKPFMISTASDTDLWMFITTGGGLTAGRADADGSLFPYLTVDQLHNAHHHTGPLTLIHIERENEPSILWKPFADATKNDPAFERNLYKNITGNRLVFEEVRHDLDLAFRYCWSGCNEFGWVRTSTLENRSNTPIRTTLLDGLRNILPHGAPLSLYQSSSNLVDAYKKNEIDPETGLGIFSLTAGITDRAEALEVLTANTVWCCGLESFRTHLSEDTVDDFKHDRVISSDTNINGSRGHYFVSASQDLAPLEYSQWHLVADVGLNHLKIAKLRTNLLADKDMDTLVTKALQRAGENLRRNVASADGIQLSGSPKTTGHHFSNVLFNNMRGGIFLHNYELPTADFVDFLQVRNHSVATQQQQLMETLPDTITVQQLWEMAKQSTDDQFQRLCYEYLPLYFGRRHGDPSRPWNRFSISASDENGQQTLDYQGNWRDIFQNWEALCTSFPNFLPSIVAKFVNASTVEGFNPYRITRDGVDWETINEDDPWSNIGYWGDHQIIYLLKLLEGMDQYHPGMLENMMEQDIFSFAEVPYIIKPYAEILKDPKASIEFDHLRADKIESRTQSTGTDGKLLHNSDHKVYQVNLLEKLLIPALSKLSNLVPDGGIWMNTQRPEWNDANNALAGDGASVVTLCYLRRYLAFMSGVLEGLAVSSLPVSTEVRTWFEKVLVVLDNEDLLLQGPTIKKEDRKRFVDSLGMAFSEYRASVYADGFASKSELPIQQVLQLVKQALKFVDWGIRANRREDGLFHAYNLLDFSADDTSLEVLPLQVMLEGQVAVLSSGVLEPQEALDILQKLFASDLYRDDQHSFILYPERKLPGFLDRNVVPTTQAQAIDLVRALLEAEDAGIVATDETGTLRFNSTFQKHEDLERALDLLKKDADWADLVVQDRAAVSELFETVFQHKGYTGRSGVMYGYEGLGCIYWHMVAKLLLAAQEIALQAQQGGCSTDLQQELAQMYYRIRSGLGYEKSVAEYGAFPLDPYSHTPASGGAKQPGMTGQVKEEILTRRGELGVLVESGTLNFQPTLLRSTEFLPEARDFNYFNVEGKSHTITLPTGCLAFTVCQVPVIYERTADKPEIQITLDDGSAITHEGHAVDAALSAELFGRNGRIRQIKLSIPH